MKWENNKFGENKFILIIEMNPTSHSIFGRRIIVEFVCRHTHLFYCNSSEHQQTRQNHSRLRAWYFSLNAWFLILQRRVNWIQNIFMRVLSDSMFGLVCVQRKNQRSILETSFSNTKLLFKVLMSRHSIFRFERKKWIKFSCEIYTYRQFHFLLSDSSIFRRKEPEEAFKHLDSFGHCNDTGPGIML